MEEFRKEIFQKQIIERQMNSIREKEGVTFFVGSGFSKYAGIPTGVELAGMLLEKFNLETLEKFNLDKDGYTLLNITQFIEENFGRAELLEGIREYFNCKDRELYYHKKLLKIAQADAIITSNFDDLFELAFEEQGVKVLKDADIIFERGKIPIYKIHGDFSHPEKIVLTRKDFEKLVYEEKFDTPFWSKVSELLSGRTVIYLGYSIHDMDVKKLLEERFEKRERNILEGYLVSPEIPKEEDRVWLERNRIEHINLSGEEFIVFLTGV